METAASAPQGGLPSGPQSGLPVSPRVGLSSSPQGGLPASLNIPELIAKELKVGAGQVRAVLSLFEEGCTVPFIARYRKEATGSLDETVITAIRDRNEKLAELDKRRTAILTSLTERELLTDGLRAAVLGAATLTALEDIYLPYRPKRRTRASIAAEKGLKPLADLLLEQDPALDPQSAARAFVNEAKDTEDPDQPRGVSNINEALAGALDIIAERVSEDIDARQETRRLFARRAVFTSACVKGKEEDEEAQKYRDYFDWEEPAAAMPSHRVLALLRGEREGFLNLSAVPPEEEALSLLKRRFVRGAGEASRLVASAVEDGYRRLLKNSMENELRAALKRRADAEAIHVFAENVREVLMSAPMGQKATLAIDPGIRTGCKVVCLDRQGGLLDHTVIYLHASERQREAAAETVRGLVRKYAIEAIAVGNGTAGREAEAFVRALGLPLTIASVNESGASIYSASEAARREFPDQDVTVRGAVSIGRRLMDPMAELVKIDPKSIGVGQYQHDVDQKALKQALDDVVAHCVNAVGVNVNTASPEILSYVSGLNKTVVAQIVKYREANGPFPSREAMKKVPRLGPKTWEQAIGFLRVQGGENPLDASAVHPESYAVVGRMAQALSCSVADLITRPELRGKINLEDFVSETTGLPTLKDILAELERPGRDPRAEFEAFAFDPNVHELADLQPGMVLPGLVTNVTAFGAFVDIGVHQDGLVHVSRIADVYVETPNAHLKPGQQVRVAVLEVDTRRNRIALSMRKSDLGENSGGKGAEHPLSQGRSPLPSQGRSPLPSQGRSPLPSRGRGLRRREEKSDLSLGSLLREQLDLKLRGEEPPEPPVRQKGR
ncbi:MAG: RNA-binding transcriptional accessory protein [Fretibacterium sp.]|nr:RNA-binding transcriptional accessory protein [Fretibacterium sp.]